MLTVIDLKNCEKWDAIVRSFRDYDIYWMSGYVKAFFIHGDGEPLLFYYEDENTRGINVVMKRDISRDSNFKEIIFDKNYYDFATPYGYGGWIIEGDNYGLLFKTYEEWCLNNGIVSEFVRFHPVLENHKFCEKTYEIVSLGNTVAMDLGSPDIIWNNIHSKNRNMIRKAKKNGVAIYSGRYPEIYREFREIYNRTMDRDNAKAYYYFSEEFYESILNDLPQNAQVFYALYDEKIIAASIMLAANRYMNYHLSGSLKEYAHLAPSNLLLYEAALWGNANGYKSLYLGGGVGSGEDNLYKFKKAFYKPNIEKHFHIGKKIFIQEKYNELVELRNTINSEFFPKYRA